MSANSSRPPAAPCSSTRSASCRPRPRSSCLRAIQEGEVEPVGAPQADQGRRPHRLGHQSRPDRRRQSRPFPRGPVLPPACLPDHGAAVARAARRHPGADPAFPGAFRRRRGQAHPPDHAGSASHAHGLPLAGQYPPARKHVVPRRRAWPRATPSGSPNFRKSRRRSQPSGPDPATCRTCRRAAGAGFQSTDLRCRTRSRTIPPPQLRRPPCRGRCIAAAGRRRRGAAAGRTGGELIRYAVTHYRGQMSEVARRLQIGRSTLYRKLEALGLNSERDEADSEAVAAERQPLKIA